MKRTPMTRKPMQRKRVPTEVVRGNGELKVQWTKPTGESIWRMPTGELWPAAHIPEEPGRNFKRTRDDCFRWRVEDLLHAQGWLFWHLPPGKAQSRADPGFPDLFCTRERIMFLELKVRNIHGVVKHVKGAQLVFANRIALAGGEWHEIVYPDDNEKLEELTK